MPEFDATSFAAGNSFLLNDIDSDVGGLPSHHRAYGTA
jgi:hypothetical protein